MEKNQLPLYTVEFDINDKEQGIMAVSFVEFPAIESPVIFLSGQDKPNLEKCSVDDVQQIVTGAVLIPDKKIYRLSFDGVEKDIVFTKEKVERIARNFFQFHKTDQTTLQHEIPLEGNFVIESWFKVSEQDKSIALGLPSELPVGTWFLSYYVPDKDLFMKMKTGEIPVGGFSIEAFLNQILIPTNTLMEKNKKSKSFLEKVLTSIENLFKEELNANFDLEQEIIQMKDYKTKDGITMNVDNTTKVATIAGKAVTDGEYELEDSTKVTVKDSIATFNTNEKKDDSKEQLSQVTELMTKLSDQVKELSTQLSEMKTENTTLKAEIEKLGKQPAVPGINTAPKPVSKEDLAKMTTAERIIYNVSQMA